LLFEENRRAHVLADEVAENQKNGTDEDQSHSCAHTIKKSFKHLIIPKLHQNMMKQVIPH
jgi:HPt (histidine-containing phosphotransfer) domain-containing protein